MTVWASPWTSVAWLGLVEMLFALSLLPFEVLARARYSVPAGWSLAASLGRLLYRNAAMMMTAAPMNRYVRLRREAGIEFQSNRGRRNQPFTVVVPARPAGGVAGARRGPRAGGGLRAAPPRWPAAARGAPGCAGIAGLGCSGRRRPRV